jgi:hypothetical protein
MPIRTATAWGICSRLKGSGFIALLSLLTAACEGAVFGAPVPPTVTSVSYTHLRAHET